MHSSIVETSRQTVVIQDESDVYAAVGLGRRMTTEMGFGPNAQACAQTIIAELARNALRHGGGGAVELRALQQGQRHGLEIIVEDRGPGISDLARALDGAGTNASNGLPAKGAGLGVGLSSVQRLADEFTIDSAAGSGTRVRALKWDGPYLTDEGPSRRNK
jgi:serine/threonine-protein kinase RsbT